MCGMSYSQADPVRAILRHAGGAASSAAADIKRASAQAGAASHMGDGGLPEAVTARERELLIACEVLLGILKAM